MKTRICGLVLALTALGAAVAETPEPGQPVAGFEEELTVTGTREERPVEEVPAAVGVVGDAELKDGRQEGLDSYLNTIPGVFAPTNDGGSDAKISIRGFGARSTFGVRDILVLVDGVPITDADGFTRLDQIDLASAERVEVVKGPASALYGNAAFGGVINVLTRRGSFTDREVQLGYEGGDLGFHKAQASLAGGLRDSGLAYSLHLSDFGLDGFREHNETETLRLNGTLDWFRSEKTVLRVLANLSQMRDEIPGALNREQFETDPTQVRAFFQLFDWRRDDDRYRLGGVVEHQLGANSTLEGRLFVLTRDLDHPIFQVIDQTGLRFLGGLRYSRTLGKQRLTVGFDGDREDIDNQRFRNVFGGRGERLLAADETVTSYALFAQDEWNLGERWKITLGGRLDHITVSDIDRLRPDAVEEDRDFDRFSPKLGILWQVPGADANVYLNLATAFQVPTKSELTSTGTDDLFNLDLEPQVAQHAEIGVRGVWKSRLRYALSLFQTEVQDEILPRTVINDTTVYGNVGETRHRGVEVSTEWLLPAAVSLELGYGWSDNVFTDFGALTGNTLPGHPEHRATVRLATRRDGRLNGSVAFEYAGRMFLNDTNTESQGSYTTLAASLRYDLGRWSFFVHGTNLTDELYSPWVAVNDPVGNFFLPSPGRAFTGGVTVRF